MKVNFIFVRHGYGCHNAIGQLYNGGLLSYDDAKKFQVPLNLNNRKEGDDLYIDPELTQIGADASAYNGCIISKTIRKIGFQYYDKDEFSSVNIIGCSPLIRSMETAYEMTKSWSKNPSKIYVFPYLREINESSEDKYNEESKRLMNIIPSYAMKPIKKQKEYLKDVKLNEIIDFNYIENNLEGREEAGDIEKFIQWFKKIIIQNIEPVDTLNVFIVSHAGVLRDFVENSMSKYYKNEEHFVKLIDALKEAAISTEAYPFENVKSISDVLIQAALNNQQTISAIQYLAEQSVKPRSGKKDKIMESVTFITLTLAPILTQINQDKNGFENNSGFIISYNMNKTEELKFDKYISLPYHFNAFYPFEFFNNYNDEKYIQSKYYCPSGRCSDFCKYMKYDNKKVSKINVSCQNKDTTNLRAKNILKK